MCTFKKNLTPQPPSLRSLLPRRGGKGEQFSPLLAGEERGWGRGQSAKSLLENLGDDASTDGATAFANGKAHTLLDRERSD